MLEIDGSCGSGGGQILRTALAFSMITQTPFSITNIRAKRPQPGLKRQHLHCIKAFQKISDCKVVNAVEGAETIQFHPAPFSKKRIIIDLGTAGSLTLILQSLLPALLFTEHNTHIELVGGTDVEWSPSVDYLENVIIPHYRLYADISFTILKRGYYPKGGGKIKLSFSPRFNMADLLSKPKIDLVEQGNLAHIKGIVHASKELESAEVAQRIAMSAKSSFSSLSSTLSSALSSVSSLSLLKAGSIDIRTEYVDSYSKGAGITCWALYSKENGIVTQPLILGSDVLGKQGVSSEKVGADCANKLIDLMKEGEPVDPHLADNLIPLLGIFGGSIRTSNITEHTKTNMYVVEQFFDVKFKIEGNTITSVKQVQ